MEHPRGYDEYAVVAEFYDYVVPYRERRDVDFFVELARQSGGPVLEIGSGTGRVLIPTARAGVEIVGLDSSASMMEVCRAKLAHEPQEVQTKVQLVEGDMRQFDLGREFRLVTVPFRPFQHLISVEDQMASLATIRRHLLAGDSLVLDLFNPSLPHLADDRFLEDLNREPPFTMPDGRRVLRRHHILGRDFFRQTQEVELIYRVTYPDGHEERFVHRFVMRYLFRYEAEHLLARSGFEVEQVYADYDKSPYGSKYPGELILVAKKA
ncbi:MAG: class I SAM-dependent methyltransferase [Acidobacteriia bacterium]|nr:class I SAM-dependent methyltransferase [Terriglobia bacterium]